MSSSFYFPYFNNGITGPTGPTGPTGGVGNQGPAGLNDYGDTGSSIIGLTLDAFNSLLFTFEDNSTVQSSPIRGATGPWQVRISGTAEGATNSIFYSSSQSSNLQSDLKTYGDSIVLRNFKTNTPDIIGITLTNSNLVSITYFGNLGTTFNSSSLYELVIGYGAGLTSGNETYYDAETKSFRLKTRSYLEGITNVSPVCQGTNIVEWNLDTDLYTVFQLRPPTSCPTNKRIINMLSTVNSGVSRGITIIVPSGITSDYSNIDYLSNDLTDTVKFPFGLPLHLTDGLDVINMISMGPNKWYANFAVWNSTNTNSVSDNSKLKIGQDIINSSTHSYAILNGNDIIKEFTEYYKTVGSCLPSDTLLEGYQRDCITPDATTT